jgi:NAD(P)-dependent dehydrogenase (short-subunit alcohol dehydrogenase family)
VNARSCVVTGSASGMGAAIVSRFRASGWQVCGVDRRNEVMRNLIAETLNRMTSAASMDFKRLVLAFLSPFNQQS